MEFDEDVQNIDPTIPPDPDLANLPRRGESGNKAEIRVTQFDGVPENYKKWKQQMIAYLVQHGTQKYNDYVLHTFLDSKLKPNSAVERLIESIREKCEALKQLPLTFSQEMGLIRKWYTPRKDNTC